MIAWMNKCVCGDVMCERSHMNEGDCLICFGGGLQRARPIITDITGQISVRTQILFG